jgi:prepilin-type N-terminal cleavage/methylation domain-containing protein
MQRVKRVKKGFTLLEILLVIAAIGILAAIVLVAINPAKQIEAARTAQRRADINNITKAIQQSIIDNAGVYPGGMVNMSTNGSRVVCKTGTEPVGGATDCTGFADLRVLVPTYMAGIPAPNTGDYIVTRTANGASTSYDSSNIWAVAGSIEPTLDLNFARDKQLTNAVTGTNPISFTRGSIGTYTGSDGLIKTAAIDEARFDHNPTTGESLGLLVEEQRTNLLLNSALIGGTNWTNQNGISVTTNTTEVADPIGTNTASKLVSTLSNSQTLQLATLTATVYNGSVYLRTLSGTATCNLVMYLNAPPFTTIGSASVTVTNAWQRFSFATSTATAASYGFLIGVPSGTVYAFGAQLEAGAFPTSYIPTTTATVTRAADVASITGANFSSWYNQTEGTVFAEGNSYGFSASSFPTFAGISDGTGNNKLHYAYITQTIGGYLVASGGANVVELYPAVTANPRRAAFAAAANNYAVSFNGASPTVDTAGNMPAGVNQMQIGNLLGAGATNNFFGTIKRLTYWPARLPNTTLQSITQ